MPRIPKVAAFSEFVDAGESLARLHLNYETVDPFPLDDASTDDGVARSLTVQRMKFATGSDKRPDRSRIVFNGDITLSGIPDEAHRYMLGPRSAIEWIIDRYQVKVDKASGIKNDPNVWCTEHGDPRYIVDLVKRVVTVSVETMRIVDGLPSLDVAD